MIRKVILLLVLVATVWLHGNYHGKSTERLIWQQETNKAVKQARAIERQQQDAVNAIIQKQFDDLAAVNGQLITDVERLRNRPGRSNMPTTARTECEGASGAGLFAEDAIFLRREAARADEYRTGLIACYEYADSLRH